MSNKKQNTTNKGGRPSKYKSEFVEKVYKLALLGATDKEMADILGVSESTFNEWKNSKEGFSESLKKGKIDADANVTERLYKRAIGYKYIEKKTEVDDKGATKVTTIEKTLAPDITAQIFWLKNRQPNKWRDKTEVEQNIKVEQPLFLDEED